MIDYNDITIFKITERLPVTRGTLELKLIVSDYLAVLNECLFATESNQC
jgi:hypothetical protein